MLIGHAYSDLPNGNFSERRGWSYRAATWVEGPKTPIQKYLHQGSVQKSKIQLSNCIIWFKRLALILHTPWGQYIKSYLLICSSFSHTSLPFLSSQEKCLFSLSRTIAFLFASSRTMDLEECLMAELWLLSLSSPRETWSSPTSHIVSIKVTSLKAKKLYKNTSFLHLKPPSFYYPPPTHLASYLALNLGW